MRFLLSVLLSVAVLAVVWTAGAQGTSEAISGYSNASAGLVSGTAGWSFAIDTAITVTELGCLADFFSNNNGATQIQVGLWGITNGSTISLLASNTITSSSTLFNQSRYQSVTPVLLNPGTYSVGVYYSGGAYSLDAAGTAFSDPPFLISTVTNSPDLALVGIALNSGGFSSPTLETGTAGNAYLGPNFQFQGGAPIPEPSSCLLLSLAALLLAARRRCQPR
jgi:hypothetical protein